MPTQTEIPCGNVGFLTLLGVLCWGACGQRGFRKSRDRDTAWQISWWSLSSVDWDARPGRARAEQGGPPRGQGVFFVVEVLRMDDGSEWRFESKRSRAIGVGRFARGNSRRRLSKIIQWLKQGGEGARGVFKGGACACWLKFWEQMILSERNGWIRTRELEEGALRNDWTIEIWNKPGRAQDCNSQDGSYDGRSENS